MTSIERRPGLWVAAAALLTLGAIAAAATPGDGSSDAAMRLRLFAGGVPVEAGERERLERAARDRVATARAAHGERSPEAALAMLGLAHVLWGLEEYEAALPENDSARAILRETRGAPALVGAAEYQAADLRRATGDYAGALEGYRRAIAIWEKLFGADSIHAAAAWHYMGVVHAITGDEDAARVCLERALAIREAGLGPNDPLIATTLLAIANLGLRTGGAAAALFQRAQAIWERASGADDAGVARALTGRARLLLDAGDTAAAGPLLDRALAIRIRAFGPEHHLVASSRADRARLLAQSGRIAAAEQEYAAALDLQRKTLGRGHPEVAMTLAALARVQWEAGETDAAVATTLESEALARDYFRRSSRDLDDESALRYAGVRTSGLDVALTALARPRAGAPGAADSGAGLPPRAARDIVDALIRSRALVLDAQARPAQTPGAESPGLDDVLRALPADDALLAYARYERTGAAGETPIASYLAMVLRPGRVEPAAFDLGAAAAIDAAVAAWRRAVTTDPRSADPGPAAGAVDVTGERLRRAIWDPMAPSLAGARQVFVVPDGAIDLVGLAALPAATGGYLIESGPTIHYLSAERDLVRDALPARSGHGILIVGDPAFDAAFSATGAAAAATTAATRPGDAQPLCPEFANLAFEPLPGAAAEAEAVAALGDATGEVIRLSGAAASKASFEAGAPGRRVLHLATHAYVLPERCGRERPLLRAGLAFAGANGRGGPANRDGILTGEEIATLDLSSVEWVVLSACDSGLGEVRSGEGVVGLRRAFERAGAGAVIMSLWDQDDAAASLFMRDVYGARRSGLSTAAAMREAGLRMIARQRARGRSTHPYFWGGFVAAGDWR